MGELSDACIQITKSCVIHESIVERHLDLICVEADWATPLAARTACRWSRRPLAGSTELKERKLASASRDLVALHRRLA